jgi:hypothetical protein
LETARTSFAFNLRHHANDKEDERDGLLTALSVYINSTSLPSKVNHQAATHHQSHKPHHSTHNLQPTTNTIIKMQFTTIIASLAMLATSASAADCTWRQDGSPIVRRYRVRGSGVPDIPGICGGLWDNMNGQSACGAPYGAYCDDLGNGNMEWGFVIGSACNSGAVEAVWWEATKNNYGAITCNFGPI